MGIVLWMEEAMDQAGNGDVSIQASSTKSVELELLWSG